jgi:hypothetical protein
MLTGCTNVCQNAKPPFAVEYNEVYYEFGPKDPIENYTKKTENGPVRLQAVGQDPVKDIWSGTCPAARTTIHEPEELLDAMLADLKARYPGTPEKPSNPILIACECVSKQVNMWENNKVRLANMPAVEIDADTAATRLTKTLKQAHKDWSDEKIAQRVKLMLED